VSGLTDDVAASGAEDWTLTVDPPPPEPSLERKATDVDAIERPWVGSACRVRGSDHAGRGGRHKRVHAESDHPHHKQVGDASDRSPTTNQDKVGVHTMAFPSRRHNRGECDGNLCG
jgi:hypothetical protein